MTVAFATSAPCAARRLPATAASVSPEVYRRRRAVVGVLLAGLLALISVVAHDALTGFGSVPASAAGAQSAPVERSTVVASAGDTLWSLARLHHGDVDFDRFVERLISLNGGTQIQVGQAVLLP